MAKDIQHYLEHPEEVDPTDTTLVNQLLAQTDGAVAPVVEPAKEPEKAPDKATEKEPEPKVEAVPAADKPATTEVTEPTGILAPDGKSIIPYSVLKAERATSAEYRGAVDQLTTNVADLQAQLTALQNAPKAAAGSAEAATTAAAIADTSEQLNSILEGVRAEAPWLAEAMEKMHGMIRDGVKADLAKIPLLEKTVTDLRAERDQEAKQVNDTVVEDVNTAIDSVPVLAHFRADNPQAWDLARKFDASIRELPKWDGKPLAERFKEVTRMVVDTLGQEIVPESLRGTPAPQPKAAATGLDAAGIKAKATAALEKVGGVGGVTTLTDIAGGAAPAQSEEQALETMSTLDLHAKFAGMTPQQAQAYLSQIR